MADGQVSKSTFVLHLGFLLEIVHPKMIIPVLGRLILEM